MDNGRLKWFFSAFLVFIFLVACVCTSPLFAREEDVEIVREGDRTRITVKTKPSQAPAPKAKGILEAAAQGVGGVAYESTKVSTDAMGTTSDLAARGFSTIGSAFAGVLDGLVSPEEKA